MESYDGFQGLDQWPRPYRTMVEHDPHPRGSVEWRLWESMVFLGPQTAVDLYTRFSSTDVTYRPGVRPELDAAAQRIAPATRSVEDRVRAVVAFGAALGPKEPVPLDALRFGGTEEEIIARGSDWCTDVARVGAALLQVAGVPSRVVMLADPGRAYSGHTVVEAWRGGVWGAVDPTRGVVFRSERGVPLSVWQLMQYPELLEEQGSDVPPGAIRPGEFRWAAIANYRVGPTDAYDYSVGAINGYYRSILTMADEGWPGGVRWLFGEDRTVSEP